MVFEVVVGPDERKVSNLDELIKGQGDRFYVDQIVDKAKMFDRSIKKTADLNPIIAEHGFDIIRDGQRFLAVREVGAECIRCHQRLP